tara:strand:+ start:1938 stop:2627 length:690 start_codon:yes stop_codon:yes gene_type:complete
MIFNYLKKTKVKYIILTENGVPKGFYPNINYYPTYNTGCPAMASANNKILYVNAPYNIDIEFGLDKEGVGYYNYEFDDSINPTSDSMHNLIKQTFGIVYDKNLKQLHLQILQPYQFVTDNRELEVTTLPTPIETTNGHYVVGAIKPYNWIRNLNFTFMSDDIKKITKVSLRIDKPIMMYSFNNPIDLQYIEPTDKILNYREQSNGILEYRKKLTNVYKDIVTRRPKKIL